MLQLNAYCIIGLDLAGLDKKPSGIASLKRKSVQTKLAYTDEQIIEIIENNKPNIIAIDAPLSVTAALTAELYLKNQTEQIGEKEEGYIIEPKKIDWRNLKL